jgi:ABC-type lipoprotein release transport system permease subunit
MLKDLAFWIGIASKFLRRSTRATAVLSLMIVSAVAAMIFLSAICLGVNSAMIRNSVELYPGHITGTNVPRRISKETLLAKGVKRVLERAALPGVLSRGERRENLVMIEVDPLEEADTTALPKKTVEGRYLERGERGVYLSLATAEKLDVHTGEDVSFDPGRGDGGFSLRVSGIYQTGFEQLDRGIAFCPQGLIQPESPVWSAAVFLEEGVDPAVIIAVYESTLRCEATFKPWTEQMPDLRQLIDLNYVSMGIVLVLVFSVVSLGVGCAFVIFMLKNIREFGIMKSMGATPFETALLIAMQVVLVSLAASSFGLLLGCVMTWISGRTGIDLTHFTSHNRYFTVSGVIFPRLTLVSMFIPPGLALMSGLASAIWPAAIVARKKTAHILRII